MDIQSAHQNKAVTLSLAGRRFAFQPQGFAAGQAYDGPDQKREQDVAFWGCDVTDDGTCHDPTESKLTSGGSSPYLAR